MEGPRAAKIGELQSVIDLINLVFRLNNGMKPTMGEEFPLLLCEDNLDNVRVMVDGDRPISDINYYKSEILVQGFPIKAASIGAVCTHPDYRGKNLASTILDDVEERIGKEGTDIMLVSGARGLYLRRGCTIVGGFKCANILPGLRYNNEVELIEYDEKYLEDMAKLYSLESTRFVRSLYEFKNTLRGQTVTWWKHSYKVFLLKLENRIKGYAVVDIITDDNITGSIVEYGGDRNLVSSALGGIINMCGLSSLKVTYHISDPIDSYLQDMGAEIENTSQLGTVKIINYVSMMKKLKPYFAQYITREMSESLEFAQEGCIFIIRVLGEELRVEGMNAICSLIFGKGPKENSNDELVVKLNEKPLMKAFIDAVFPLPFPWAGNINFI
jgi:Predicted acetyltransferase